ncbi:hypothetical protein FOXYSP1_17446 [Fusarium oxysporum f. sp. phaseoli]
MSGPHLEDNMEWVSRNRTLPFRATAVGILCLPTCSISRPWNLMDPNLDISTSSFEDPAPATGLPHHRRTTSCSHSTMEQLVDTTAAIAVSMSRLTGTRPRKLPTPQKSSST